MKQIRNLFLLMAIAATAMLSSCSSGDDVMEVIPADVDFLVKIDGTKLLDAADIKIDDDKTKLPKEINDLMGRKEKKIVNTILTQGNKAVDLSQFAFYGYFDARHPEVYAAVPVKSDKELDKLLTETPEDFKADPFDKDEEDGYVTYTKENKDVDLFVKDDMLFMVFDDTDALGTLKDLQAKVKEEKSFKDVHSKIIEQADKDAAVVVFANTENIFSAINKMDPSFAIFSGMIQKEIDGYWAVSTFDIKDKTFTSSSKYVNDEGKLYSMPYGQKISKDVFKYMPADFMGVAALGVSPNDINKVQKLYNQYAGQLGSDREIADKLMKHITQINGTIAVGLGAKDLNAINKGDLQYVAVAQMKPGAAINYIKDLKSWVNELLQQQQNSYYYNYEDPYNPYIQDLKDGFVYYIRGGSYYNPVMTPIYVRSVGNDLVISNIQVQAKGGSNLTKSIGADDVFAMALNIASLSEITNGQLDFGFNASVNLTKQEATFKANITGTKKSLIQVIMSIANFGNSYNDNSYDSYDYGYDSYNNYGGDSVAAYEEVTVEEVEPDYWD